MITVVNIKEGIYHPGERVYIHRPFILGNPYKVSMFTSREKAIALFEIEFMDMMINKKNTKHFNYTKCLCVLERIRKLSKYTNVYLLCYCKPLPCHGDIIKQIIDNM